MPPFQPSESDLVSKGPCNRCPSSDACALYSDGHTYCYACCHTERGDGETIHDKRRQALSTGDFVSGEVQALPVRKLTEETCQKFSYRVGKNRAGSKVQIAEYFGADGTLVAQKLRDGSKNFTIVGEGKDLPLFGQHLWPTTGRRLVITEGELDAMSVSQVFDNKWPVVSLPSGAASAKKCLSRNIAWLEGYEEIVLMFDQDEPGRAATTECCELFTPGRVKIAALPADMKDASDCVQAGLRDELRRAVYDARVYRPDGIVNLEDIRDRVLAKIEMGRPYKDSRLNERTYGRRVGDVIGIGGGTGCGKTDWLSEQIEFDVMTLGITTGVLLLEQSVGETGRRLAGKGAGKRFHIPDGGWEPAELVTAWDRLEASGKLFLFDSFGACDWATIKARITYMATALGCEHIYLDHMTALAAAEDNERTALEKIMAEAAGLAKRLGLVFHYVSHLATPEGKPHEEGGRVMGKHFKGSRALQFWSHAMFGIERDTQAEDLEIRSTTTLRCLKDRNTGRALGRTWGYGYDDARGLLVPKELIKEDAAGAHGFVDEGEAQF